MKRILLFLAASCILSVYAQNPPEYFMGNNWAMEDMSNTTSPSFGTNQKGVYFWRPKDEWYFTTSMTRVADAQAPNGIGYVSFVSTHTKGSYHPVGIGFGSDANGAPFSIDMSAAGNDTVYIEVENVSDVDVNIRVGLKDINNNLIDTKAGTPLSNIPSGIIDMTIPKKSVVSKKFSYHGGFYAEWGDFNKCTMYADPNAKATPCGIQKLDFTKVVGANITINSTDPQNTGLTNVEIRIRKMQFGNAASSIITPVSTLVNPNATPVTRAVKAYLDKVYGKKIISGQDFEGVNEKWLDTILVNSKGKQPAIIGLDFMNTTYDRRTYHNSDPDAMTNKAIDWYKNKHGLVEFHWHWDAPKNVTGAWYQAFYTKNTTFSIKYAMDNQTSEDFKLLVRDIDDIAAQLKRLQNEDIPVIWRPLHEGEGDWFWWGAERNDNGASIKKLWNFMYDRLTNYHKLNNLIWVWNSYGDVKNNWYPGDNTVDIIGYDYENKGSSWNNFQTLFGGKGKLFGLAEEGTHPNPDDFAARSWLYFLTWAYMIQDPSIKEGKNTPQWTYKVYNDSKTITLSDLPWPWVKDVIAEAGNDQTITVTGNSGSVQINASASSSVNGAITSYQWTENGKLLASTANATINLPLGMHKLKLSITDIANKTDVDSIYISIKLPNLALNKPQNVSSTEATYGNIATNANDGKSNTRWSSLYTDPQWISIDLQDTFLLSSAVLLWEAASAKDYTFDVSIDGKKWTSIVTKKAMNAGLRNDTLSLLDSAARFVRVSGSARTSNYGYSLFEIEVYGEKLLTQNIPLQKGWNMISTNLRSKDSTIASVFKGLDVVEIKNMNSFWRKSQDDVFNGLKSISSGNGYLVNMNTAGTLTIAGTVAIINTVSLPINNLTLIGCPYQSSTAISSIYNETNCSAIKNFDGFWKPNGTANSLQNIELGKAYFIIK